MKAISHIAIGVRDMEKSLHFYRDLLGLQVTLDKTETVKGMGKLFASRETTQRRAVYLRFEDGPHASFIVLSQPAGEASGAAIKIDQLGIHHFAFWVDDLRARVEKLKEAGVPILVAPAEVDAAAYGEPSGRKVLTSLFQDPDGIIVQLDQRLA